MTLCLKESQSKKPTKNLNFATSDQSAAWIQFDSQSKAGASFRQETFHSSDCTIQQFTIAKFDCNAKDFENSMPM